MAWAIVDARGDELAVGATEGQAWLEAFEATGKLISGWRFFRFIYWCRRTGLKAVELKETPAASGDH